MANRTTKVTLTAEVQGYVEGMDRAAKATRETGSESEKLAQKGAAIQQMSRAMLVAGGTIATGLGFATKAAIDWDTAWAGVTKTVDGSPEQLAEVEAGLRDLTKVLPASHAEIAAVAEAAGQLGIQTPNVVAFTRTMIDLGETTNLTSAEAATQLARFMNVMGTSQDQVSNLGSALVALGNNYATTEAEILSMAQRLSGAGSQIKMSEGEVFGLATALSSVGIEAEAGGSAMSKVMIDIASSVDEGGKRVKRFADVAGMSADEFTQKWRTAPGEALAAFVKGLAGAEEQGKSTFAVLDEFQFTEVRMRDALLRSASAADQFSDAMAMGNEAFAENNALTEEAEKRYETTAAKLDIMRNKVVDAAIGIGEQLLPLVEGVAEGIGNFADMLSGLEGPMEGVVAWGGLILATGLLGAGLWMAAVPKIAEYRRSLESLNLAGGKLDRTMGVLGRTLGGLAIVGVVAAFIREAEVDTERLANNIQRGADATKLMQDTATAYSSSGWGGILPELSLSAAEVAEALDDAAERAGRFGANSSRFPEINNRLSAMKVLAGELANQELPAMQASLKSLADEYDLTDEQQLAFINNSSDLKKALEEAALDLGLTTDEADLLRVGFGDLADAAIDAAGGNEDAAEAAEEHADALAQLEGKAAATSDEIDELAARIRGLGSATLDLREANRRVEQSYQDFTDAVHENGFTLDTATDQGRAVEASIDDMVKATLDAAAATLIQTGSQEEANAKLAEGRERIIDMIAPYMESREAAAAYIDELGLTPTNLQTFVELNGTEEAERQLRHLSRDRFVRIATWTDSSGAERVDNWAFTPGADGFIEAYADGGISTGIYRGGKPIHKFAEPETVWEAYISGKADQRDRNRQIWVETGNRLDVFRDLEERIVKALGGSQGAGTTINYTSVNPVVRDDFEDAWGMAQEAGWR